MAKQKILIVDDEPFNVDYIQQELEDTDYETLVAVNGQDALDKVRSDSPDLVLLDIMMPVMDGFAVLSRLKADPVTRDIPIIIISASSDLQSVVKGVKNGAEDYLSKPFEPTLLHARITSSLEKKQLRDLQALYLKSLKRELEIAREIQTGFLPGELPQVEGWQIAAYFKAAREVAGDYYDAFQLPDKNLALVIGDVCGKGVGAALFMTLFRSLVRATVVSGITFNEKNIQALSPMERIQHVVAFVNNYLNETHPDAGMFSTLLLGILNPQSGTFAYANCGNESPLILRGGRVVTVLKPTGPVVGILPGAVFRVMEVNFEIGDTLLMYTDGIPDAQNVTQQSFDNEHLLRLLDGFQGSAAELIEKIHGELDQFCGTTEQFDDITMLSVKRG